MALKSWSLLFILLGSSAVSCGCLIRTAENASYPCHLGTFGSFLQPTGAFQLFVPPPSEFGCGQLPQGILKSDDVKKGRLALLLPRGRCSFYDKAGVASRAGFAVLVISDVEGPSAAANNALVPTIAESGVGLQDLVAVGVSARTGSDLRSWAQKASRTAGAAPQRTHAFAVEIELPSSSSSSPPPSWSWKLEQCATRARGLLSGGLVTAAAIAFGSEACRAAASEAASCDTGGGEEEHGRRRQGEPPHSATTATLLPPPTTEQTKAAKKEEQEEGGHAPTKAKASSLSTELSLALVRLSDAFAAADLFGSALDAAVTSVAVSVYGDHHLHHHHHRRRCRRQQQQQQQQQEEEEEEEKGEEGGVACAACWWATGQALLRGGRAYEARRAFRRHLQALQLQQLATAEFGSSAETEVVEVVVASARLAALDLLIADGDLAALRKKKQKPKKPTSCSSAPAQEARTCSGGSGCGFDDDRGVCDDDDYNGDDKGDNEAGGGEGGGGGGAESGLTVVAAVHAWREWAEKLRALPPFDRRRANSLTAALTPTRMSSGRGGDRGGGGDGGGGDGGGGGGVGGGVGGGEVGGEVAGYGDQSVWLLYTLVDELATLKAAGGEEVWNLPAFSDTAAEELVDKEEEGREEESKEEEEEEEEEVRTPKKTGATADGASTPLPAAPTLLLRTCLYGDELGANDTAAAAAGREGGRGVEVVGKEAPSSPRSFLLPSCCRAMMLLQASAPLTTDAVNGVNGDGGSSNNSSSSGVWDGGRSTGGDHDGAKASSAFAVEAARLLVLDRILDVRVALATFQDETGFFQLSQRHLSLAAAQALHMCRGGVSLGLALRQAAGTPTVASSLKAVSSQRAILARSLTQERVGELHAQVLQQQREVARLTYPTDAAAASGGAGLGGGGGCVGEARSTRCCSDAVDGDKVVVDDPSLAYTITPASMMIGYQGLPGGAAATTANDNAATTASTPSEEVEEEEGEKGGVPSDHGALRLLAQAYSSVSSFSSSSSSSSSSPPPLSNHTATSSPPEKQLPPQHALPPQRRVRVGFVSSFLRAHSVGRLMAGVITGLDERRIEAHVFLASHFLKVPRTKRSGQKKSGQKNSNKADATKFEKTGGGDEQEGGEQEQDDDEGGFEEFEYGDAVTAALARGLGPTQVHVLPSPTRAEVGKGPSAAAVALVLAFRCDVLVYPELGMDALTVLMATHRLAPLQLVFWGHPVSQGLPSIDYFVSSDLFEDHHHHAGGGGGGEGEVGGGTQYHEQLIRLEGLSTVFAKPRTSSPSTQSSSATQSAAVSVEDSDAEAAKANAAFRFSVGLPSDAHVYLVPQTLMKFHPSFDSVLASILALDPFAVVVATVSTNQPAWQQQLETRLSRASGFADMAARATANKTTSPASSPAAASSASSSSSSHSSSSSFAAAAATHSNFNFHGRVRFLPSLPHPAFLQLLKASSVVLDPFPFGGGVTTLEALAAGTPVVTLPAKQSVVQLAAGFYRAMTQFEKQQQGELQQESVQWPIAVGERHFVRLAVAIASGAPAPPAPSSLPLASDNSAAAGAAGGGGGAGAGATRIFSLPVPISSGPPPPSKKTKMKKGTRLNEAEKEGGEAGGAPVSSFREQLRRRILASHQALYQDDKAAQEWTELLLRLVRV